MRFFAVTMATDGLIGLKLKRTSRSLDGEINRGAGVDAPPSLLELREKNTLSRDFALCRL